MKRYVYYLLPICLILVVVFIYGFSSSDDSIDSDNYLEPLSGTDADNFKANATIITVADLLENSEAYKGKKVKITGEIFDIRNHPDGTTSIMLSTLEAMNNTLFIDVTYKGKVPYVSGDSIVVYGEGGGNYSYISDDDYLISYPLIKAVIIEKQ